MPIIITNGLGNAGNSTASSLLVTGGYGAPGQLPCAAFLALGVVGFDASVVVTLNSPFNGSGPAARADGYSITLVGAGQQVTVNEVVLNGPAGQITLFTSLHSYNASYTLHMPEVGLLSTDGRPFQGAFQLNYLGGLGIGVSIQLTRAVDARLIDVIFNRRVNESDASDPANYSISPTLKVLKARKISDLHYRLTTEQQVIDLSYTVTISNIRGAA